MKYHKILLKISGEAFGEQGRMIDDAKVGLIVKEIKDLQNLNVKVAIVCGGGNTIRGINAAPKNRLTADYLGMKATFKNIEALSRVLKKEKIKHQIFTSFSAKVKNYPVFTYQKARAIWQRRQLVIIGGGIGYPFFSTDTASVLRSLELDAELLIKATKVDGVYSADPKQNSRSKKYHHLTGAKYLEQNLKVMDMTAVALAMANKLPIRVIKWASGNVVKTARGKDLGTLIN